MTAASCAVAGIFLTACAVVISVAHWWGLVFVGLALVASLAAILHPGKANL